MLKKAFISLTAVITFVFLWGISNKPIFYDYAKTFEVYLHASSSVTPSTSVNGLQFLAINGKKGEACKTDRENFDLDVFLKKFGATIKRVENTADSVNYYAFSPYIRYSEKIGGKTVNLHISIAKEVVTLGSPIIYGSF